MLYARNTFAFASPGECFEFVRALNPHWAALVTKVSLLALTPIRECPVSAAEESDCVLIDPKGLQEACIMLQKLPALSELELDALFLTRPDLLDVIREAPLRNLRKISFTKPMEIEPAEAPREFVWPRRALRKMIEDTELAVCITWGYGCEMGTDQGDRQVVISEQLTPRSRVKEIIARSEEKYKKREKLKHPGTPLTVNGKIFVA